MGRTDSVVDDLLDVRHLTVKFGGVSAVDGVDFRVGRESIVSIVGPNGAGKTTVLNSICGFVPARGEVLFKGTQLLPLPSHRRARLGIARTFQAVELFPDMSLLDNVITGRHSRMKSNVVLDALWLPVRAHERSAREAALELLASLGIQKYASRTARSLPFGIQKLAGVARALASAPELLLLDEPAAGLNRQEATAFAGHVSRLRSELGMAIVLVEHNMRLVMQISDHLVVLHRGTVIAEGPPASVSAEPAVIEAYLGSVTDSAREEQHSEPSDGR